MTLLEKMSHLNVTKIDEHTFVYEDNTIKFSENTSDVMINNEIISYDSFLDRLNLLECNCCGKLYGNDDLFEVDGDFLCEDCVDDTDIVPCSQCGELHYDDNIYYVDDEPYCEGCYESLDTFECYQCGETHLCGNYGSYDVPLFNERGEIVREITVCECCIDGFDYCDNCEEYYGFVDGAEVHFSGCPRCNPPIHNEDANSLTVYNGVSCYHPNIILKGVNGKNKITTDLSKFKGYGIELEVDKDAMSCSDEISRQTSTIAKLNEIAGGHMYFSHDGSLQNGFEIVTQPHTESAMRKIDWEKYLSVLKNDGYVEESTHAGYHIHISRNLFGKTENAINNNVAKLIFFFENNKKDLIKMSRRTESGLSWCPFYNGSRRWVQGNLTPYDVSEKGCKEIADKSKPFCRIRGAVNLGNSTAKTVEIRLFRSTLNVSDFRATFDFITTLVNNVKSIDWKNVSDNKKWLKDMPETVREYIKRMGVFSECV